jgi:RHH-type rel operon transcriptional repressor/antitoxin RelB
LFTDHLRGRFRVLAHPRRLNVNIVYLRREEVVGVATERQRSHPSGQVVSVRLPPDLIRRLDTLSERTGRSRGTYLRMAVRSMLPALEQQHWNEIAADFENRSFENEFVQIMNRALNTPPPDTL